MDRDVSEHPRRLAVSKMPRPQPLGHLDTRSVKDCHNNDAAMSERKCPIFALLIYFCVHMPGRWPERSHIPIEFI
jgi:hypothetical protein